LVEKKEYEKNPGISSNSAIAKYPSHHPYAISVALWYIEYLSFS
jgi:hypothetical protein